MKKHSKSMLITYNAIEDIPSGRQIKGNVLIYSGDKTLSPFTIATGNEFLRQSAEKILASFRQNLFVDLGSVDQVFVYVGNVARESATALIEEIVKRGKKVYMISCDCFQAEKKKFSETLSVPWFVSDCSGCETCSDLIKKLS